MDSSLQAHQPCQAQQLSNRYAMAAMVCQHESARERRNCEGKRASERARERERDRERERRKRIPQEQNTHRFKHKLIVEMACHRTCTCSLVESVEVTCTRRKKNDRSKQRISGVECCIRKFVRAVGMLQKSPSFQCRAICSTPAQPKAA